MKSAVTNRAVTKPCHDGVRLQYGMLMGLNSSTLVGENSRRGSGLNRRAERFTGGLFLRLQLTPCIYIQPEMLLSLKGTDFEFPTGESDGGLYFTYLEYSTLARAELPWRLTLTSKVKLHSHVVLGPWAGFLLSAESVNPDVGSGSVRSAIKTFDFGVTGGFGVVAEPVWWGALELSARYVFGIPQIGDPNDELDRDDAKHRTISVMVGFRCCAYRKRTPPAQQGREPYETDPKSPVEIEREVPVGPEPRAPNALGAPDEPEPGDDSDDAEPVDGDRANGVQ